MTTMSDSAKRPHEEHLWYHLPETDGHYEHWWVWHRGDRKYGLVWRRTSTAPWYTAAYTDCPVDLCQSFNTFEDARAWAFEQALIHRLTNEETT